MRLPFVSHWLLVGVCLFAATAVLAEPRNSGAVRGGAPARAKRPSTPATIKTSQQDMISAFCMDGSYFRECPRRYRSDCVQVIAALSEACREKSKDERVPANLAAELQEPWRRGQCIGREFDLLNKNAKDLPPKCRQVEAWR